MTSVFPTCGPECLKDKKLKALKTAMDSDPSNSQAQTNYYTELYGPGWLQDHKEELAKNSVAPIMTSYREKYDALQSQLKSQKRFSGLAKSLETDKYLVKDYQSEKSKADVMNRMWVLAGTPETEIDLVGILLYVLIAVLALAVIGLGIVKYRKYTAPPSILGGNRLRTK
jgi:hypothetical protein